MMGRGLRHLVLIVLQLVHPVLAARLPNDLRRQQILCDGAPHKGTYSSRKSLAHQVAVRVSVIFLYKAFVPAGFRRTVLCGKQARTYRVGGHAVIHPPTHPHTHTHGLCAAFTMAERYSPYSMLIHRLTSDSPLVLDICDAPLCVHSALAATSRELLLLLRPTRHQVGCAYLSQSNPPRCWRRGPGGPARCWAAPHVHSEFDESQSTIHRIIRRIRGEERLSIERSSRSREKGRGEGEPAWASGMHAKQYSAIPPYLVVGGTSIEYSGGSMGGSGIPTVLSIVVAKQSIQAFREGRSWRSPRTISGLSRSHNTLSFDGFLRGNDDSGTEFQGEPTPPTVGALAE